MMITTVARACRTTLFISSLAVTGALVAQGLSYDVTTVGSGPDRSGNVVTRNMSSAHGQFAAGNSRLDFTQSLAPSGMMSAGTYLITNGAKRLVTTVNPATREYIVLDLAELGKASTDLQSAMGGMAKT